MISLKFIWFLFLALILQIRSKSHSSLDCCLQNQDNSKEPDHDLSMIRCVNSSISMKQSVESSTHKLTFAMFASPKVYSFAAHNILVNAIYFEKHGYAARLLGIETGDDFHPIDRRWNKVRSIIKALDPNNGWASTQDALIYIDTDLVIIDWNLDPYVLLSKFPEADLLLSADALDVGNTGFLILRNTVWLRDFMKQWWESRYTSGTFCDQHVLNKLYHNLKYIGESKKVQILAGNAVNSKWPAMETFHDEDKVLHLMGETPSYRTAVALYTSNIVCETKKELHSNAIASDIEFLMPKRLGFTRDLLVTLARSALEKDRNRLIYNCGSISAKEEDFEKLHESITNSCDDKRPYLSSSMEECEQLFLQEYQLAFQILEPNYNTLNKEEPKLEDILAVAAMNRTSTFRLYLAEHMTKVLYDVVYFTPSERKQEAALRVTNSLDNLANYVDMNQIANQRYIKHKRGLLYAQLSSFYVNKLNWSAALEDGIKAIDEYGAVMGMTSDNDPDFSGYVIDYIDCASQMSDILIQLTAYNDALDWAQTALNNAQILYQTYSGEKRVMAQELARLHLLVAEAFLFTNNLDKALEYIQLSRLSKVSLDNEEYNLSNRLQEKERNLLNMLGSACQKRRDSSFNDGEI